MTLTFSLKTNRIMIKKKYKKKNSNMCLWMMKP